MNFTDKNNVTKNLNFLLKVYTTPIKIFSVDPTTEDPDGCLDMPTKINKKIDVKGCTFSTANTKLKVFNFDCKTSKWFYSKLNSETDNIYNKKCQLIAVIDGVEKIMFTGYFRNFDNDVYENYYEFEVANLKEKLKESIFDTQLSEATLFETRPLPKEIVEGVEIDYFTKKSITKDNEIVKYVSFTGHPLRLAKGIFKTLFGDEYDNVIDLIAFDESSISFPNVYFEWYEALDNPGSFLETQIYRLLNKYPVITEDGKITLISQELPSAEEVNLEDILLKEEDIKDIKKNKTDLSMLLNNIRCSTRYDFYEGEYKELYYLPDEDSFKKYSEELFPKKPYTLEFQGLNNFTVSDRTSKLENVTKTLYARYADFTKAYDVEVFFSDMDKYQIGNYLILESSDLIDNETGERGLVTSFSEDSKAYIGTSEWASYTGSEENDSLGYFNGIKIIEVGRIIDLDFFNSITTNHNNISNFLTGSGV